MDPFSSFAPQLDSMMCGNAQAKSFLVLWRDYCHQIDDLIDADLKGNQALLRCLATAIELYCHPFYLQHLGVLMPVARRVTLTYAIVVDWEHHPDEWRRQWADHFRHAAVDMWIACADLIGGYDHALPWVRECFATSYLQHHDPSGKPV
jgi:hypothetical protein